MVCGWNPTPYTCVFTVIYPPLSTPKSLRTCVVQHEGEVAAELGQGCEGTLGHVLIAGVHEGLVELEQP